jgi:hypothetical protein
VTRRSLPAVSRRWMSIALLVLVAVAVLVAVLRQTG